MCQLLGMCFNQPISPSISFRGFRLKGKSNPHGWGIAFFLDNAAQVIKEMLKACKRMNNIKNIEEKHMNFQKTGLLHIIKLL